ncbi:uncharacterized protein K452DRAFT_242056 [Aplosporella prunicola CBS 121167]|uniref:SPT2 chromatin protein n=1 Tax=Aplosporella prunicola CBS 121167 TaxID=1176127 RepID=A0A6A6BU28_9PEZI|nr:uncharacterized protein K452DRAFT_242056 [Aplosporella prunicola CBS 121167]KAF2146883.1 hypothetical protein K452DRAFT_242056 [Aplosporella prunicola CBS 121167]
MSFLDSVLSSIGGGQPSQPRPSAPSQAPATKPTQSPRVGGSSNGVGPTSQAPKRKAEGEQDSLRAKTVRRELDAAAVRSNPAPKPGPASPLVKQATASSASSIPYRGTAQSSTTTNPARKPATVATTIAKSGTPTTTTSKLAAKPTVKPSVAPVAKTPTAPQPKKGSFAEIMARAKAAQTQQPVGTIKHKPVEKKLSKKEKLAQEADAKTKQAVPRNGKPGVAPIGQKGQSKAAEPPGSKPGVPAKEKRKPVDLGYSGTMRPSAKEPTYQGTMKSGGSRKPGQDRASSYDRSRSTSLSARPPPSRYRYAEDEEDDEEEDYESESDMEAGMFDVDREEMESLRVARREDELALKEEEEHRRRKLLAKKRY